MAAEGLGGNLISSKINASCVFRKGDCGHRIYLTLLCRCRCPLSTVLTPTPPCCRRSQRRLPTLLHGRRRRERGRGRGEEREEGEARLGHCHLLPRHPRGRPLARPRQDRPPCRLHHLPGDSDLGHRGDRRGAADEAADGGRLSGESVHGRGGRPLQRVRADHAGGRRHGAGHLEAVGDRQTERTAGPLRAGRRPQALLQVRYGIVQCCSVRCGTVIIIIIVTSFAPISSKIKLSGATKPGD